MTELQWRYFHNFRKTFKEFCIYGLNLFGYKYSPPENKISSVDLSVPPPLFNGLQLDRLQRSAAFQDAVPDYPVETPIVYNHNLDDVRKEDNIKLILVGDNPGKDEQRHFNQRYLVGQSGRVAGGFFKRNPELGIDFKENVIILNKSILHTAKTVELKHLLNCDTSDKKINSFFIESQKWMAVHTAELQKALGCEIWVVGYSQLNGKGLFHTYAETLTNIYKGLSAKKQNLVLYRHFSMNCFLNDLNKNKKNELSIAENLKILGESHRKTVLGF